MEEIIGAVGGALLAGLFALGGSYLGTRFAIGQYKAQKAHDLRLEWYLRLIRSLQLVHTRLTDLLHPERPADTVDRYLEAQTAMLSASAERRVFGTPRTIGLLDDLHREMRSLMTGLEPTEALREYRRLVLTVFEEISIEARQQALVGVEAELELSLRRMDRTALAPKRA